MPTTRNLTAYFDHDDWQAIRAASMRGKLAASFERAENGEVAFRIRGSIPDLVKFCEQISAIVDFGAISAGEAFCVSHLVRRWWY